MWCGATLCWCKADENTKLEKCTTEMDYLGNGKFKCPRCKKVYDNSKHIYHLRLKFTKLNIEDEYVDIKIVSPFDERILKVMHKEEDKTIKDCIEEDLIESDDFEKHKVGVFDCDILWLWYECGGEFEEWDLDLGMIQEKVVL